MQCSRSCVVVAGLFATLSASDLASREPSGLQSTTTTDRSQPSAQSSQAASRQNSRSGRTESRQNPQSGQAPAAKPAASWSSEVAALLARIEAKQQSIRSLQLSLEIVNIQRPAGDKPFEIRALVSYYGSKGPKGARARLDADFDTPEGLLRSEKVRTADGVWLHTKSSLAGEKWIQIDKRTMERLDKAQRIFGGQVLPTAGSRRLGAVVGAELLRGLGRDYVLSMGQEATLGGVDCYCVEAKRKKSDDPELAPLLPQARADHVQLFFSKKHLLLHKFVELSAKQITKSITVRALQLNPKVDEARFVIRPPKGVRWVDILSDKLFSVRAKMELERLRNYERSESLKNDSKGNDSKGGDAKGKQGDGDSKSPGAAGGRAKRQR